MLNKPFADVANEIALGKRFTQHGLRRTFIDLARAAQVSDLVTRSISGHQTEAMQRHYSTINATEQRFAIGQLVARTGDLQCRGGAAAGAGADGGGAE